MTPKLSTKWDLNKIWIYLEKTCWSSFLQIEPYKFLQNASDQSGHHFLPWWPGHSPNCLSSFEKMAFQSYIQVAVIHVLAPWLENCMVKFISRQLKEGWACTSNFFVGAITQQQQPQQRWVHMSSKMQLHRSTMLQQGPGVALVMEILICKVQSGWSDMCAHQLFYSYAPAWGGPLWGLM